VSPGPTRAEGTEAFNWIAEGGVMLFKKTPSPHPASTAKPFSLTLQIVERVSTHFEPSLWIRDSEIENLGPETGAQNAAPITKFPEI